MVQADFWINDVNRTVSVGLVRFGHQPHGMVRYGPVWVGTAPVRVDRGRFFIFFWPLGGFFYCRYIPAWYGIVPAATSTGCGTDI